ncbi:sigma-70 family RNA polymerase sigma factor [Actinocatenispora rupis]|uniref:RNA polymerase sigma factor n=1 Tax=Actinocatenispora rupis TaxID=519421 RepID=A0A8J3IZ23_9ACTN|nr:sigma-70 family RNA polymerase sigma factor [Actinocatenispora rupis]GID11445.1 RNA polymerase sigma factor [Actinocatenispora rupis]
MSAGDTDAPAQLPEQAEGYRRELLAHCYRMLGSVHEAEDLVQETYLRAWRSYGGFEGRSSLRTWLHRIATTACLTALEGRSRRPLPTGLGAPASDPDQPIAENHEVPWLSPVPDTLLEADPAGVVTSRESVRLAFVAALQHLPPRQRAVLVLREVLQWRAAEVAEAMGMTVAGVNSALQRARAQLREAAPTLDGVVEPTDTRQRELLDAWVAAFEAYDIDRIVAVFTKDTVWEMPPFPQWYQGAADVGALIARQCPAQGPGDMRLVPVRANAAPGFAMYMRDPVDGTHKRFAVQVLTLTDAGVAHTAMFFDDELFAAFGLPPVLPSGPR